MQALPSVSGLTNLSCTRQLLAPCVTVDYSNKVNNAINTCTLIRDFLLSHPAL